MKGCSYIVLAGRRSGMARQPAPFPSAGPIEQAIRDGVRRVLGHDEARPVRPPFGLTPEEMAEVARVFLEEWRKAFPDGLRMRPAKRPARRP